MTIMDKSELLKKIGQNIKKIRKNKGLAQLDIVANITGNIDVTNISRIEAGRTNPTIYTLFRIANAMDTPLSSLTELDSPNE